MDKRTTNASLLWCVVHRNRLFLLVCLLDHLFLCFFFFLIDIPIAYGLNILSSLFYFYFLVIRRSDELNVIIGAYFEIILYASFATIVLGMSSGFYFYTLGMLSVIFHLAYSRERRRLVYQIIGFAFVIISNYISTLTASFFAVERIRVAPFSESLFYINMVIMMLTVIGISSLYAQEMVSSTQRLNLISHTDVLTSLPNRRFINDLLEHAQAVGIDYTLCMIDIDDFKLFNDTYGHQIGDLVLQEVARILKENIRSSDTVARWGGEEFMILLPHCSLNDAELIMEKARSQVDACRICVPQGELHVTITAGISHRSINRTYNEVIREADANLYVGKRHGKNRVVSYGTLEE